MSALWEAKLTYVDKIDSIPRLQTAGVTIDATCWSSLYCANQSVDACCHEGFAIIANVYWLSM